MRGAFKIKLAVIASMGLIPVFGQNNFPVGSTYDRSVAEHERLPQQFGGGDTNVPLLALDWFSHGAHFCRVNQSGHGLAALDAGYAIEGGNGISLDAANQYLLVQAINELPLQSQPSLPQERQILVSGIRSNQWFRCVYDRGDVPESVERLFTITGAYLEWFMPKVEGRPISHSDNGGYRGSQSGINSFAVASGAPVAVSTGLNGLQIWDLNEPSAKAILPLDNTPYRADLWSVATISPDGTIIIFTGNDSTGGKPVYAMDWQTRRILWEINDADTGNTYEASDKIFAVGNEGSSLFLKDGNVIGRWDMADGKKTCTLATNQSGVNLIQTSRNGKILLAGFGDRSFMVWRTDRDEPVFDFSEPEEWACATLSADGDKIILCTREQRCRLVIWDWQTRSREEVPLRLPHGALGAYSLYGSPDGKWLAANAATYPASIVVCETRTWKPTAQWSCEQVGGRTRFGFRNDGVFLAVSDHDISGLDMTKAEKSVTTSSLNFTPTATSAAEPPVSEDKDFQVFLDKIRKVIDPLQLQSLALAVISQRKPDERLSELEKEDAAFLEFMRRASFELGPVSVHTDALKGFIHKDQSECLVVTRDVGGQMGLIIGDQKFKVHDWFKNREVVSWRNGIYFWRRIQKTSTN